jgi:hypothetical protein
MSHYVPPKVILTSKKDENYNFLSSRKKTYRFKDIIIIGKIVILPEYIQQNICNNTNQINMNENIFNENTSKKIKYLKENKVINNYNSDETIEIMEKNYQLYQFFVKKNKSYWNQKTKNVLMEQYKTKCNELGLKEKYFFTKKDLLNYCLTNPAVDHLYSYNNKYVISNTSQSNMEEGFKLSPSKDFSVYECIFRMFSMSADDRPYYFKKYKNDNIAFIINNIHVLIKPLNNSYLYRLLIFMLEDGLEEIFGNQMENSAKIIQKNWRNFKSIRKKSKINQK